MYITMHCAGMPFNGDTIKTDSLGGSETAAYYMALELAKKGHTVRIFTESKETGEFDGVFYEWCGIPSERFPMGELFHNYAENVPCDVMIIQRSPYAFKYKYASKINLWWVHDLALYRSKEDIAAQFMNVDGVLTVSEYHKKQICEVYGLNPDNVYSITNGIDLELFNKPTSIAPDVLISDGSDDKVNLLYSSRPERGLENLVKVDGIMDKLLKIDPKYHLYVCMYANYPEHMKDYYNMLFQRIELLPNCTNLGSLTKQELADVMRQCDALVYPTNFEEVSCITAMEAMAAGLPFISSKHAA
ncbi:MAG TPA: glycosyltransferase, partial [Gammaproteobacteria bacterium]|nr:glycosyltransferase [Gammaproteobacteria bacterium]